MPPGPRPPRRRAVRAPPPSWDGAHEAACGGARAGVDGEPGRGVRLRRGPRWTGARRRRSWRSRSPTRQRWSSAVARSHARKRGGRRGLAAGGAGARRKGSARGAARAARSRELEHPGRPRAGIVGCRGGGRPSRRRGICGFSLTDAQLLEVCAEVEGHPDKRRGGDPRWVRASGAGHAGTRRSAYGGAGTPRWCSPYRISR